MEAIVEQIIRESIKVKQEIVNNEKLINDIQWIALKICESFRNGGKLVLCGNGGSASDALHFAGELLGRFQMERMPLPAIVLNADVVTNTCISNDYGYDEVFARQVKGLVNVNDFFMGISTSGNSENVIKAAMAAKEMGAQTAALIGKGGGRLKEYLDYSIIIPSDNTARIQECHITIIHSICEIIEKEMNKYGKSNFS